MIERAELERVGRADPLRTLDTFVLYINIYMDQCAALDSHTPYGPPVLLRLKVDRDRDIVGIGNH